MAVWAQPYAATPQRIGAPGGRDIRGGPDRPEHLLRVHGRIAERAGGRPEHPSDPPCPPAVRSDAHQAPRIGEGVSDQPVRGSGEAVIECPAAQGPSKSAL